MAYKIVNYKTGEFVSSGQTRAQVLAALDQLIIGFSLGAKFLQRNYSLSK